MVANTTEIEKRLWEAADQLRANSKLRSSEYSVPVLGLIFLRYADFKFKQRMEELHETLELLNAEAHELEERIAYNMRKLLNGG